MTLPKIQFCPGTLAGGFTTYSRTCLKRVFNDRKVHHILPYNSPSSNSKADQIFEDNRKHISISGVQEKFSLIMVKNKLKLAREGEKGTHILKPIPTAGKRIEQMPANEHLTMQIARQMFKIETAENALIFFADGTPAYITKRFDINLDGTKNAQDDFASLAGKTPQTHGEHYKYSGNYLDLFELMKYYLPAYRSESPKLLKLILFNYLFSNGDAHLKNFSITETDLGDYRLSPAYDLLNSRIHVDDKDFALNDGLLPKNLSKGNIRNQFSLLAKHAEINEDIFKAIMDQMLSESTEVKRMIHASFLSESSKRNYWQTYQNKFKQLMKF